MENQKLELRAKSKRLTAGHIRSLSVLFLMLMLLLGSSVARAQTVAPAIFFTDLTSAPNSGGESVSGFSGAYVTIFGNNFGSTQGTSTVTWNGNSCLRVVSWSTAWLWYQRMVVQLGSSCTAGTGSLVVTTSTGSSNGVTFTVRDIGSNHIYFVATTGSDSAAGTAAAPFNTMRKCKNTVAAGDICYIENGVNQTGLDNYGALDLSTSGSSTLPIGLLTYPGAALTSTIGSNSLNKGLYACKGLGSCNNGTFWVVQGFNIVSNTIAVDITTNNVRIIGNMIQCPAVGAGTSEGCMEPNSGTIGIVAYGNESTNVGAGGKQYHAFYFGTDGHDYDIGWNKIHDIQACRAIQLNGSVDGYNILVHDNLIYNIPCDGINLATVNPNTGYVKVYNNVVYHAGSGPDQGGQNATCVNAASHIAPTVPVLVYNNTFYDCGALGSSDSGIISAFIKVQLTNNILSTAGSEPYVTNSAGSSNMSGSNNLYFGNGNGPSQTTGNVNANPSFINASIDDLHLQSASPAIGAGTNSLTTSLDHDGLARPNPPSIGAYEFQSAVVTRPNPPTNLSVVIQ